MINISPKDELIVGSCATAPRPWGPLHSSYKRISAEYKFARCVRYLFKAVIVAPMPVVRKVDALAPQFFYPE